MLEKGMECCVAISARLKHSRSERGEGSSTNIVQAVNSLCGRETLQGAAHRRVCCFDELPPMHGELVSGEV